MCHCAAKLVGTFHFLAHEAYMMVRAKYATLFDIPTINTENEHEICVTNQSADSIRTWEVCLYEFHRALLYNIVDFPFMLHPAVPWINGLGQTFVKAVAFTGKDPRQPRSPCSSLKNRDMTVVQ
jgi:hypothetical protein